MRYHHTAKRRAGFTLVEVVAALFLISLILAGAMVAYSRTTDSIIRQSFMERAASVAQRRLELLLASRQEPDGIDRQGHDDQDPDFYWEMNLTRVVVGGQLPKADLSNTVIQAEVRVTYDGIESTSREPFVMARCFSYLKPLPGQSVAVPLTNVAEEPQWYIDLRERLGRDPTADESFEEMDRLGLLPPGMIEMLRDLESEDESGDTGEN